MAGKNTSARCAPISEAVFKSAARSGNPRRAATNTRLRVKHRAGKATKTEFKTQRLQGAQSRCSLAGPANHSAGAARRPRPQGRDLESSSSSPPQPGRRLTTFALAATGSSVAPFAVEARAVPATVVASLCWAMVLPLQQRHCQSLPGPEASPGWGRNPGSAISAVTSRVTYSLKLNPPAPCKMALRKTAAGQDW